MSFNPRGRIEVERRQEEIAAAEAHQDQKRLVHEAEEASGGTPLQRLWHRFRGTGRTEDPPPPAS